MRSSNDDRAFRGDKLQPERNNRFRTKHTHFLEVRCRENDLCISSDTKQTVASCCVPALKRIKNIFYGVCFSSPILLLEKTGNGLSFSQLGCINFITVFTHGLLFFLFCLFAAVAHENSNRSSINKIIDRR